MVQLTLPQNSKITEGKTWQRPTGARHVTPFRIYRWNPDDNANPRMDTYFVDRDDCAPMVLDALIWRAMMRFWKIWPLNMRMVSLLDIVW